MARFIEKMAIVGLLLSLAGLSEGLAQTLPPDEGANTQIIIRRDGRITNVIVSDESNSRLLRLFAELRALPPASDDQVVQWITENQLKVPPYFLYELARRRFAKGRAEAMAWFLVAGVRARYDALRCHDRSAGQEVLMLPDLAADVALHADANRAEMGRIGLAILQRPDIYAHEASAWWVCSRGVRNSTRPFTGTPLGEWLKPEAEWPAIRTQLSAVLARYFEEQGRPQDDPIPSSAKAYIVVSLPVGMSYNRMAWVDSERLAVRAGRGGAIASPTGDSLIIWSRERGLVTVADKSGFHFCAGHGNVAYIEKVERAKFERGRPQELKVTAMFGPPERIERIVLAMTERLTTANTEQIGGSGWTARADDNPYKQSGIDCRWAEAPRIAALYQASHWQPLLPGHGFLGFNGKDGRRDLAIKSTVFFHATGDAEGVPLAINWGGLGETCVRYYAFKQAYYISLCMGREVRSDLLGEKCMPGWWFHPESARLEQVCNPVDSVTRDMIASEPTKVGLLRIVETRQTYHGPKPGALYLTDERGRTERIYTHRGAGRIADARVSPDGCQVAFREMMSRNYDDQWQARVLTLC